VIVGTAAAAILAGFIPALFLLVGLRTYVF
jgi:hypothetical protein